MLDPLSTIIKLALLNKYEDGVKISIKNNIITIQKKSYYQGIIRWFNNDNKFDLDKLFFPIIYASQKYLIENNFNIKIIFEASLLGIQKLINTYSNNILISNYLKYLHLIINYYLFNSYKITFKLNKSEPNLCNQSNEIIYTSDLYIYKNNNIIKQIINIKIINNLYYNYNSIINDIWSDLIIKNIVELFDSYYNSNLYILIDQIHIFIKNIDINYYKNIKKII